MNKSMKPIQPAARQQMKPLTPEEKKEQIRRAFLQKRASLAECILFNALHNPNLNICHPELDTDEIAKFALSMADSVLKVVYNQELTLTEEE